MTAVFLGEKFALYVPDNHSNICGVVYGRKVGILSLVVGDMAGQPVVTAVEQLQNPSHFIFEPKVAPEVLETHARISRQASGSGISSREVQIRATGSTAIADVSSAGGADPRARRKESRRLQHLDRSLN
jgi:hypothetical protein